jgi:hypothetical protein
MRARLFLKALVYFFGTFLHEVSHFFVAACLGKAEGFSLVPRIEGDSFVFGSVRARVRYKVLLSLIAIAPLVWWLILFWVLRHLYVIRMTNGIPRINFSVMWPMLKSFSLRHAFFLWLFMQMLWAGKLSLQDVKEALRSLFSLSGLVVILTVWGLLYCWRDFSH